MKSSTTLALIFIFFSSSLSAEQYTLWELETKVVFNKVLSSLVEFNNHASIIAVNPLQRKNIHTDSDYFAPVPGSMIFYLKSKAIVKNIEIPEDLEEMYLKESLSKKARDFPFLGEGQQYLFFNKKQNKYYYCFIEWDKRMTKWNQGEGIWDTGMLPSVMIFLDKIPRIDLAPLTPIGDDVFIKEDISITIDETEIPHFIDKKAKMPIKQIENCE